MHLLTHWGTGTSVYVIQLGHHWLLIWWPVTGEFPTQRPVTRSFDIFLDLRLNRQLNKQWWGWWFETPSRTLWRHCHEYFSPPCVLGGSGAHFNEILIQNKRYLALMLVNMLSASWRQLNLFRLQSDQVQYNHPKCVYWDVTQYGGTHNA